MQRILGFAGKKQSGKNTASNYLHGVELASVGEVEGWGITEKGELILPHLTQDEDNLTEERVFDLSRIDPGFIMWAANRMWPLVKQYSFADLLKRNICVDILGLTHEQCYGTDSQKTCSWTYDCS
jgi:hypothetical protein